MQKTLDFLTRGCTDVISRAALEKKLQTGKKLRVKLGADPTSADLHLGHSVVLSKLRHFQDMGHTAVLVIGDFTAGVGDPSGRNSTRPMLERGEILKNAETYTDQVFKILDQQKTEVRFNSEWLDPFTKSMDFLNLLSKITVGQAVEREDFKKRMDAGVPVSLIEIMYSIFQGYDSVALKADVELGGTDQIFNLIMGRHLQKIFGQEEQVVLTMPLLVGLDGVKKMSKSYNNYIGLNDEPGEMFGKVMSLSDQMMYTYYTLLTSEDMADVWNMHPMTAKKLLAEIMVARFHGKEAAHAALENFENVFSKHELPADMQEFKTEPGMLVSAVLVGSGIVKSKNEARRLIDQGAVRVDNEKVSADGPAHVKKGGSVLQAGRRHFLKLI